MIDPVRHRQLEELDTVNLCTRILYNSRNELYLNMHFLDISLSSLGFEADPSMRGLGTDGYVICYNPDALLGLYKRGRRYVNRAYLHMVFHCLFCHLDTRGSGRKHTGTWHATLPWSRLLITFTKNVYTYPHPLIGERSTCALEGS